MQTAINNAPDGATVVIPDGTYSWNGTLSINKAITLQGADATGVTIQNNLAVGSMIAASAPATGHINIFWLNIIQAVNNNINGGGFSISADRVDSSPYTVMIHDCTFNNSTVYNYMVLCRANGIIFWNDTFVGDGTNGLTGISFVCDKYGVTSSWNTADTYGTLDTTGLGNSYVENCTFYDAPTACENWDDNSRVVTRNCTISNASVSCHGQETSMYGVREWEVYNNTFLYSSTGTGPSGATYPLNMNNWTLIRGGSGVWFNNAMPLIPFNKSGIALAVFSITRGGQIPCQTAYPAARQTGQGWSLTSTTPFGNPVVSQDGIGAITEGVWIWNNTGTATTDPSYVSLDPYLPDNCGNGQQLGNYLQAGRDYFVNQAKPNYTPYQYPHPLHAQYAVQ